MRIKRMRRIGSRWALAGFICGALVGGTLLTSSVIDASADSRSVSIRATVERGLRDVLHSPPLLVERGATVSLRYDVVCQSDPAGRPCALSGSVYVRRFGDAEFSRTALVASPGSTLVAALPESASTGDGFSYYAVIGDDAGNEMTVPDGGAVAPQTAWVVPAATSVELGTHVFGHVRQPDGTALRASWGAADGSLGLLTGRGQATIGPSAFDIAPDGSVVVLDQVNGRLAVYPGGRRSPRYVHIRFVGVEGDLAVGGDGTTYVLDGTGTAAPLVRSFTAAGAQAGAVTVGAANADMLRAGPGGAFVHGYPGDMWLPAARAGLLLQPSAQAAAARAGRSVDGGAEVVVKATQAGAVIALVRGKGIARAWRLTSATALGEVQLAEPFGDGLVAVVRTWTEHDAEFVVLVLSRTGIAASFSLPAVEWAESAALGRFRLFGRTLYQLRSASDGAEIVKFDLGGVR